MKPKSTPKIALNEVEKLLAKHKITDAVVCGGIRGYYKDTMGIKGKNDRGIYDDCIWLKTPDLFMTFNGNTDPSKVRKGRGKGSSKGMALLKPDLYRCHIIGIHNGKYTALVQRKGAVTVIRDGIDGDYEDTGYFGINIHRGGYGTTSSLGCQTIYPDQWKSFIETVKAACAKYKQTIVPYLLVEY